MISKIISILIVSYCFLGKVNCQSSFFLASPDSSIHILITESNKNLCYSITKNKHAIIDNSAILWSINEVLIGDRISSIEMVEEQHEDTFYKTRGTHSIALNKYNGATYKISNTVKNEFLLEVKVFNDGVAFRCIAEIEDESILDDFTTFVIPENTVIWSQNNIRYYEGKYKKQDVDSLLIQQVAGPPVSIKYPQENLYAAITEGGLNNFAGMSIEVSDKRTFKTKLAGKVTRSGNIEWPWRIIIIGSLNTLVNNDIVRNVSTPPDSVIFSQDSENEWIKPGRCVWSWLANKREISLDNMKKFSEMAAELGFEYNLVDEGWGNWKDGKKDNWQLMKELVDYSAKLNVKIWVWKAYPDRKGIDGIDTREKRKDFFRKCHEIGVAGVKIDFFDNESQEIINFYQDALLDAAKYQLMINFHGSNKPTGESRTYPNEMTREGVRGLESSPPWAEQNTILPFTRYLAGHADFTPITFNEKRIGETSWCHHIATAVIYTSPLLCYGFSPDDILNHPAKNLICSLPTVWDKTIVLPPSEINDAVMYARRNGNVWFIAGLTNEAKSDVNIDLRFLGKGNFKCELFIDDPNKQHNIIFKELEVSSKSSLNLSINHAGGFVARVNLK